MSAIAIPLLMAFSAFCGYTFGNIRGFEEQERNEKKAQAFWAEIEEKGIK